MTGIAGDWLVARSASVPASLQAHMEAAVRAVDPPAADAAVDPSSAIDPAAVAQQLATASIASLRAAIAHCDERAAALSLLAADALITSACEAAADESADALALLCEEYAPERIAVLLRQS
ncbi:hypothetical protein BH23GEM9_BH23GEM9_11080 [soil metagenome]